MSPKKTQLQVVPRKPPAGGAARLRHSNRSKPQLVSGRWLLAAVCIAVAAAAACGWLRAVPAFLARELAVALSPVARLSQKTPASAGLAFDPVAFAVTDTGVPQLKGWWIPAAQGAGHRRLTVVYLHGQDGNLGDTVDALARLHAAGVNVLAFDYRGYGESQFARPSEAHWRQDAEWALDYLTGTRQIDAGTIVLDGDEPRRESGSRSCRRASGAGRSDRGFANSRSDGSDLQRCARAAGSSAFAGAGPLRSWTQRLRRFASRCSGSSERLRQNRRTRHKSRRLTRRSHRTRCLCG